MSEQLPETLLALIESQGLEVSLDREHFVAAAAAVHELRLRRGAAKREYVTRTSVMAMLLIEDLGLREPFRRFGLRSRTWAQVNGAGVESLDALFDELQKTSSPVLDLRTRSDLPIRPQNWLPLIDEYRELADHRPVDRRALLFMLLSAGEEGKLLSRLAKAGLDVERARLWAAAQVMEDEKQDEGTQAREAEEPASRPREVGEATEAGEPAERRPPAEPAPPEPSEPAPPEAAEESVAEVAESAGRESAKRDTAPDAAPEPADDAPAAAGPEASGRERQIVVQLPGDLALSRELREFLSATDRGRPGPWTPLVLFSLVRRRFFASSVFAERLAALPELADERIESYTNGYEERWGSFSYEPDDITAEAVAVLEEASRLRLALSGSATVEPRHLLGALLLHRSDDPLEGRHFPLPYGAREAFFAQLEEEPPAGEDLETWRETLFPDDAVPPSIAGFRAEDFDGPDRLGITRHVDAFAALIASQSLEPPLSIGLFGDWGSGKSFFMHKLQRRIERLAGDAERRREAGEPHGFHGSIVQVTFNAWNYVEVELWASLVAHIFESLHHHFHPRGSAEKAEWLRLLGELDAELESAGDAERTLDRAEEELAQARRTQGARERTWFAAAQDAWTALRGTVLENSVDELESTLHAAELRELREQLFRRSQEVQGVVRQAALRRAGLKGLTATPSLAFGLLVALGVLAVYLVTAQSFPEPLTRLSDGLAETLAVVGGILAWLGTALRKVTSTLGALGEVEQAVREGAVPEAARQQLEWAEADVEQASREVAERRRQVADLRSRLEALSPGQRLSRFLAERAESTDYRKHLGLPALARRDFQTLQRLMHSRFAVPREAVDGELAAGPLPPGLRRALGEAGILPPEGAELSPAGAGWWIAGATVAGGAGDGPGSDAATEQRIELVPTADGWEARVVRRNLPRIDRIVLYIDDLDRCPAERVVEVLEAVHLLLALPLFVVVVGVDARWVERALRTRHADLWRVTGGADGRALPGRAAEPHDYLEKIFQVPFWLQPMSDRATRRLLRDLVGGIAEPGGEPEDSEREADDADDAPEPEVQGREPLEEQERRRGAPPAEAAEPSAPSAVEAAGGVPQTPAPADPPADEGGDAAETADQPPDGERAPAAAAGGAGLAEEEANPPGLELSRAEVRFLQRLAAVVGRSPRTAKRFVNVYRVLRASQPARRLDELLGDGDGKGGFEPVLLLLAAVVGCPAEARELFAALRAAKGETTLRELVAAMPESPAASRQWRRFRLLAENAAGEWTAGKLSRWVDEVGRYSFRVGHATRPEAAAKRSASVDERDAGGAEAPPP